MKKRKNYQKHGRKPTKLERFYKSTEWSVSRAGIITRAKGICEKCGKVGEEVHHIIHLTIHNVDNPAVSLNPENLILLCKDCHNKEHHRFGKFTEYSFDREGNLVHTSNRK